MITGKTKSGFEFSIDEAKLDNMEFIDALAEADENGLAFSKVVRLMFDAEQRKALYDHLRTEDGRVPVEAMVNEVTDIMQTSAELKN